MSHDEAPPTVVSFVRKSFEYLVTARPTAVNIADAAKTFTDEARDLLESNTSTSDIIQTLYDHLTDMLQEDIEKNRKIGKHGAQHIIERCSVPDTDCCCILTHCNTGSLASGGYGTALGVIRRLHELEVLERAYCTETRPYNQGSRLTAFELTHDNIPSTLVCDSMSAFLMQRKSITAVVVGADRVASNGDTANKIGTYQLAVSAKYHNIPFYVAATLTAIDFNIDSGQDIVIEERRKQEMVEFAGKKIAPDSIDCWNPAFDVTPCELITGGIITEYGVYQTQELKTQLIWKCT